MFSLPLPDSDITRLNLEPEKGFVFTTVELVVVRVGTYFLDNGRQIGRGTVFAESIHCVLVFSLPLPDSDITRLNLEPEKGFVFTTVELVVVRVGTYFLDNGRQIGRGTGGIKEHKQVSARSHWLSKNISK